MERASFRLGAAEVEQIGAELGDVELDLLGVSLVESVKFIENLSFFISCIECQQGIKHVVSL